MSINWASIVLCFALAGLAAPVRAEWKVDVRKDSMTDKVISTAVGTNSSGFSLELRRIDDGSVWATFSLPEANGEVLDTQLPMFRVDKKDPVDLDGYEKALEVLKLAPTHQREPKWVSWKLFHGEFAPNLGPLRDMMDGTTVVFRYFLFSGGYKETSFSLIGAKQVIASALSVPEEADLAAAARITAFNEAVAGESKRCFTISNDRRRRSCLDRYLKCSTEAVGDAEKFRACLQ